MHTPTLGTVIPFRKRTKGSGPTGAPALIELPKPTPKERFWRNVDQAPGDACWNWKLSRFQADGYGKASKSVDGKTVTRAAHRVAWEHTHGPIPAGSKVLHSEKCGTNKLCCRPDHLRLGSNKENTEDARKLGRLKPNKLNPEKAVRICVLRDRFFVSVAALSVEFGVSHQSIINVLRGRTWSKATGRGLIERARAKRQRTVSTHSAGAAAV